MVYKYKRKNPPRIPLDEEKIRDAIERIKDARISKRKAAKEVGVSEWTIRQRMKNPGFVPAAEGGHTSLPYESERELHKMLEIKSSWGYAASKDEVNDLVAAYVKENMNKNTELGDYLRKYCRFKVSCYVKIKL